MERKHFHFIGIGGIGVGGLASLMLTKGHTVTGSDVKENALIHQLRQAGAHIVIGHKASNLSPSTHFVVYSSAIADSNPEFHEAKRLGIPTLRRAELLAQLFNAKQGVAIAGAHGKTTTSSMVAHLLCRAQLNPTTVVGGVVHNGGYHAQWGEGLHCVAEVDESDGSFLYFHPKYSVVTNMDFEHVDFYGNWENITKAYRKFLLQTHPDGCALVCAHDERLMSIVKGNNVPYKTYGWTSDCDLRAENLTMDG